MSKGHHPTVYAIGECMIEFSRSDADMYMRSFAGDVYNTAVYLKRVAPQGCNIEFISAVGDDAMSLAMIDAWHKEGVLSNHLAVIPGKTPGLYVIETDADGERCFAYWRNQSAARELIRAFNVFDISAFNPGDYLYFSGITLAILNQAHRTELFDFVQDAKGQGVLVAFDPNYRPTLWETHTAAAENIINAYRLADLVLTGVEEEASLFGWGSEVSELDELERMGVKEAILKAGDRGIFGSDRDSRFHVPFVPVDNVVDTTAAGDAYAGAYVAFRIGGKGPDEAALLAARVARIVVGSRGAIIEAERFRTQMRDDPLLLEALEDAN